MQVNNTPLSSSDDECDGDDDGDDDERRRSDERQINHVGSKSGQWVPVPSVKKDGAK